MDARIKKVGRQRMGLISLIGMSTKSTVKEIVP